MFAVVFCEELPATDEPGVSAVHSTVALPGALPDNVAVVLPAGRQTSVPAFGIGGASEEVVVFTWLLLMLPQLLLTVQVNVYTVFGASPFAYALGVLASGEKVTPVEGDTVQVPVSSAAGTFPFSL